MAACASCGRGNPAEARFCLDCGNPLVDIELLRRKSRRTVSIVFADLSGSTALAERLDPESLQQLMARYFAVMRSVVEGHGGTVEKFIGDAVMAVFGIPELHEDDALRAVRAAAAMRAALAGLNEELAQAWGVELAIRIGVNTGEVVARDPTEGQSFAIGDAVNVAARLEEAAAPGEILIGDATSRLVRDAITVEAVGSLALKGKAQPVGAHRLLDADPGARGGARRFDAALVGRERELGAIRALLAEVRAAGSCHVCTVVGPPGIGKSRLARELVGEFRRTAAVAVGRCLSYGEGITYWPLREIVLELAGGEPRDWIKARLSAEAGAVAVAERIAAAVGAGEAGAKPEETFWAFRKLFEALARERPLVLVIDDVHWAEPTLLDLLEHVAGFSAGAPILLLCLARPDLFEQRPEWGAPQPNRTVISLPPLGETESRALVERLERAQELPEQARARAVEAAEGNPLFLEQLVAFESEGGSVVMPPSIHALLAARIDRLGAGERAVLERAAIEGRAFGRAAVAELLPAEERPKLEERLLALIRKDLIQPVRGAPHADDSLRFRHILVRDAAYDGMAKELRSDLHERYAGWLAARGGEDELVGYHLEQACRYRAEVAPLDEQRVDLALRAAELLGSAGRTALKRGDIAGAANLLARAASLPPFDAPVRVKLLPDLAEAVSALGEHVRAAELLAEAVERAAAAGDVQTGWRARLQRAWLRLQTDPSVELADVLGEASAAVAAFERLPGDRARAHAWHLIAWVHLTTGRLSALDEAVQRGLECARTAGDAMTAEDLTVLALLSGPTGPLPIEQMVPQATAELERGRHTGSRRVEGAALLVLAMGAAFEGRFDDARELLAAATSIDEELGGGRGSGFRYTPAGTIEVLAGDLERAEAVLRTGYELLRESGDAWFLCGIAAELADVLWLQGRDDEALAEVLRLQHRSADAAAAAESARRLYEQKGNVVAARNVAALLEALHAPSAV